MPDMAINMPKQLRWIMPVKSVNGATLYCNLEPCSDKIPSKKTPPCTDLIIKNNIKRVVIATRDPNPYVNGDGVKKLQNAGIEVVEGILSSEANLLNEKFNKFIKTGLTVYSP